MSSHEQARLYALRQLNLLDTPPSESFDRITRMASRLFDLPIAAVSLTDQDRQWFKSRVGVDHMEIPRFKAPCGEVSASNDVLVIDDLLSSPCYADSHLAQSGIRFYAGAPLITGEGYTLGAMCVLGPEPRSVSEQELATLRDLAALVMAQIELQHAFGRIDPLTGLPNRSQFAEDLQDLAREAGGGRRFALFTDLADVAELSELQRVMGPAYLDDLARAGGRRLQQLLGQQVALYHIGPGQFVHLHAADEEAAPLAEALHLRAELMRLSLDEVAAVLVRPAIGVAPFELEALGAEDVLRIAHSACREAREADSGVGVYSTTVDAVRRRRFRLLTDFHRAVERPDELWLAYQPRVDAATGACVGAEALLRWRHPELGEISPAEFIPLIESTSLVRSLTQWVLQAALEQAARWQAEGLRLRLSINVSAANLQEADFAARLLAQLRRHGVAPAAIELELTESALIGNGREARSQLDSLIAGGVTIAIDDFGTGYSSLSYLQEIPAQVVKIDRSFVRLLDSERRSLTLVKAMTAMAHELGYSVVAEGVEDRQTYQLLRTLGVNEMQGYLIAKPLVAAQFGAWLGRYSPASALLPA